MDIRRFLWSVRLLPGGAVFPGFPVPTFSFEGGGRRSGPGCVLWEPPSALSVRWGGVASSHCRRRLSFKLLGSKLDCHMA